MIRARSRAARQNPGLARVRRLKLGEWAVADRLGRRGSGEVEVVMDVGMWPPRLEVVEGEDGD